MLGKCTGDREEMEKGGVGKKVRVEYGGMGAKKLSGCSGRARNPQRERTFKQKRWPVQAIVDEGGRAPGRKIRPDRCAHVHFEREDRNL